MKPVIFEARKPIGRYHTELFNELENINMNMFRKDPNSVKKQHLKDQKVSKIEPLKSVSTVKLLEVINSNERNQFVLFQKTMKLLLFCGQCLGLNPVIGILENDPNKLRFQIFSVRFLYSAIIFAALAFATILCTVWMAPSVNISKTAFTSFYTSTCLTTFFFMRVAAKWPALVQAVTKSGLNEYMDPRIEFKCNVATVIILSLALLEHILSFIARYAKVIECSPDQTEIYAEYNKSHFPWFYDIGVPFYLPIGILLQLLNVISTMNWNYSDLFIVCISLYLTSLLQKIKQKVVISIDKNLPPQYWSTLRDDYTRATRLIRRFDDVISSVTFLSFATNLFFICLQLFNILSNGLSLKDVDTEGCSYHRGPFGGYEHDIYYVFSLSFILGRSIVVSLIAAEVHTAALAIAPPLYDVPTSAYCDDVQRFIEQVHYNNVALSGLQFFYVTKELFLSVAATVVTYELVLLQFSEAI